MDDWRRVALAASLIMVLVPAGTAQPEAEYEMEGVTYHLSAGTAGSGHATLGLDHTGQDQIPFLGCGYSILRDEKERGRIQALALLGDAIVQIDVNEFEGTLPDMQGGIAREILVDGSRTHEGIQHPKVHASAAAWGTAEMFVNGAPLPDPATGQDRLLASWFVTPTGFRDNETGAILAADGSPYRPGAAAQLDQWGWEMHLRVESPEGPPAEPVVTSVAQPGGTPGYFTPSESYAAIYSFSNMRFGGGGTLEIDTSALAQPGDNNLTFTLRYPNGTVAKRLYAEPALGQPTSHSATVALDQFGSYILEVSGRVALSEYSLSFTQTPGAKFDLDLWWDEVTFGQHTGTTWLDCLKQIGNPAGDLVVDVVARQPPPPFQWIPIAAGILATVATLFVAIKITAMYLTGRIGSDAGE